MPRYIVKNVLHSGYTPVIPTGAAVDRAMATQFKVLMFCGEWLPIKRRRSRHARAEDMVSVLSHGVRIRSAAAVRRRHPAFADAKVVDPRELI
ncbi:MAG: hypothetical protein HY897_09495 [Deltaproteobacteria bacterium]|nr:hypothetical protein [Deltaproteobacteria bacterium]